MTSTIAPSDTDTDTGERGFPFRSSISTRPAPMTVSKNPSKPTKASLDVLISNDDFTEIACESLTIEFNVADDDWNEDAASILTPVWKKVSWPKPELPSGWVEDTSDPKPGVFTFRPESKMVGPSDALRLHLDDIHVSTCKGITDVVISVKTPSGIKDVTHSIGKFPVGFTLENFRADDPIVENGRSTKLNWTVEGDENAEYEFFVNGVKKELEGNRIEPPFDTGPLHATTVYKIVAKHQVGQGWISHSDSTVVQVHGGAISASSINGLPPALCANLTQPFWVEAGSHPSGYSFGKLFKSYGIGLIVGELRIWEEGGEEESKKKNKAEIVARMACKRFKTGPSGTDKEIILAEFPVVEVRASMSDTVRHARQHFIMPVFGEDIWDLTVHARPSRDPLPFSYGFEFYWVSLSGDNRPPKNPYR